MVLDLGPADDRGRASLRNGRNEVDERQLRIRLQMAVQNLRIFRLKLAFV